MSMTTTQNSPTQDLVVAVKDYAHKNYENGWDVVVETMTDAEIITVITGATTVMGAKRKISAHIGPRNEMKAEAIAAGQ